ncbi:hypothetical protein FACS1894101_3310 [Betaproteobacteria bacterium]|nr:hypothetical protein FACS1894101_3310 [Betaproteobacteria bacterium]
MIMGIIRAGGGTVSDNQVIINTSGSVVPGAGCPVVGGAGTGDATVTNNQLTIQNTNTGSLTLNSASLYGGRGENGNVTFNTLTLQGSGNINNIGGSATLYGGYATNTGAAEDNTVYIGKDKEGNGNYTGTMTASNIYGGRSTSGNANRNHIFMSNGAVSTLTGGNAGGAGNATHNTISISEGTVTGDIVGGNTSSGNATHNTISISEGTVTGDIVGGNTSSGNATHNTISISASGKTYADIYGGRASGAGDLFTGNTLNLAAGNTITSVRNMATINFTSAGAAGITTLHTTPTGAAGDPLMTLNTNTNAITFDGTITGSGGIDKQGDGTLTLNGTNDYSGGTTVSAGTLSIGDDNNIGSGTNTLAGGTLRLANGTYAKNWTLGTGSNAIEIVSVGDTATMNGILSGSGSFSKTGAGKLTLSGANDYGGSTTVSAGTLALTGNGSIEDSSGVTLNNTSGAVFDISTITNSGTTIKGLIGGGASGGNVDLGDKTLTVNNGGTNSYGGIISGNGSLTKDGAGTLILSGTNNYNGATTINGGVLQLANSAAVSNATSFNTGTTGTTGSTGTLTLAFDGGFDKDVDGDGNLTANPGDSNTLTLSGTSSYTGMTTVQSGTLALNSALASSYLTLLDGTKFNRNSQSHSLNNGSLTVHGSATNRNWNILTSENWTPDSTFINGDTRSLPLWVTSKLAEKVEPTVSVALLFGLLMLPMIPVLVAMSLMLSVWRKAVRLGALPSRASVTALPVMFASPSTFNSVLLAVIPPGR